MGLGGDSKIFFERAEFESGTRNASSSQNVPLVTEKILIFWLICTLGDELRLLEQFRHRIQIRREKKTKKFQLREACTPYTLMYFLSKNLNPVS